MPLLQPDLPLFDAEPGGPRAIEAPGPPADGFAPAPVEFVRMRRARRYVLRVRPGGQLRVTIPRGGSKAEALRFVAGQAEWIRRQRLRMAAAGAATCWADGGALLLRGERVRIVVTREPRGAVVRYGGRTVAVPGEGRDVRPFIEADLRALARDELGRRLAELAAREGLAVSGVSIRNQRSRWGSCSRAGRIALNFRLVQMPPAVSDYILIHELMHLRQQNHSRRFWRLVEAACPGFREAERWLRTEGQALFR